MQIVLNGEMMDVQETDLESVLNELGYANTTVATAVNETFVPAPMRAQTELKHGDRLEILAPMQGG